MKILGINDWSRGEKYSHGITKREYGKGNGRSISLKEDNGVKGENSRGEKDRETD